MVARDPDALTCDLAQYYGVLDYKSLPVSLTATLAAGLPEESRSRLRLSGMTIGRKDLLLAAAVDRLSFLVWAQTEDGRAGINRPASVLGLLLDEGKTAGFDTAEEYEAAWEAATGGAHGEK